MKKRKLSFLLFILPLVLPALIVFKNFFLPGPLAWGDAPHFWQEELPDLLTEPLIWTSRGNNFGGLNLFLWLSPIMYLYGFLAKTLGFGNDLTIRMLFYFPSLALSFIGPILLAKYLNFSKRGQFFASFVYVFNTYYLLIVDGGQVGIALAYGLFPFSLLYLKKLIDNPSHKTFFASLLFLAICGIADPRVAILSVLTAFLWAILEFKLRRTLYLIPLILSWLAVNMYWLYPILKVPDASVGVNTLTLKLYFILNPLFLFSPHWPGNVFGKVIPPYAYFVGLPLLILLGLFFKKDKKILHLTLLFLIFAFLVKGNNAPLGSWYDILVNLPLGSALRDSSKFFIPVVLFGGLLIGNTVEKIKWKYTSAFVYIYILFTIYPAFMGKLNFILSDRKHSNDFQKIYQNIKDQPGFFRTVWLPERHPLTFETEEKPALDGNTLIKFSPFEHLNVSEDWFNFLLSSYSEYAMQWFRVLGVKYIILSDDHRTLRKTSEELRSWRGIERSLASGVEFANPKKVNWDTDINIFEVTGSYPKFYAAQKIYAVVGAYIPEMPRPAVYFEDGKFDPMSIADKNKDSVSLVLLPDYKPDLAMSFLQDYFVSVKESVNSQWAIFGPDEFLKLKYQIVIRDQVLTGDFDYGKGTALSTKPGEEIKFKLEVPESGEYVVAKRISSKYYKLHWEISEPRYLEKGTFDLSVKNEGKVNEKGIEILNVVALIPKKKFEEAQKLAQSYIDKFDIVTREEASSGYYTTRAETNEGLIMQPDINVIQSGALKYTLSPDRKDYYWFIHNENYDKAWQLRNGQDYFESLPVHSMVNGYYVDPAWRDVEITYRSQVYVRWGIYYSLVSTLILSTIYVWLSLKRD